MFYLYKLVANCNRLIVKIPKICAVIMKWVLRENAKNNEEHKTIATNNIIGGKSSTQARKWRLKMNKKQHCRKWSRRVDKRNNQINVKKKV